MFRTITPYVVFVASAMHVFCCGIPLLLSVTSLAAIFGISSLTAFEIEWFEAIEDYVLLISGILLLGTFALDRLSKKIDCLKDGWCKHPPCGDKKTFSSYVLYVAALLYVFNVVTFIFHTISA